MISRQWRLAVLLLMMPAIGHLSPVNAAEPFDPFAAAVVTGETGQTLPLDTVFATAEGEAISLGQALGGRPALLLPVYFRCPNICPGLLAGVMDAFADVPLDPGRDFILVAISIDPREGPADARDARARASAWYEGGEPPEHAFRFLTGSADTIRRITEAMGYDFAAEPGGDQYSHAAALATVTPDGRLSNWLYGIRPAPTDLRLSLVEAGDGTIGDVGDQLLLLCYHYDPETGTYTGAVQWLLVGSSGASVLAIGAFIGVSLIRERRRRGRGTRS